MKPITETEIKVGIFVALGTALIMLVIMLLGGGQSIFSRKVEFHTRFKAAEGIIEGAMVKVAGVKVGQVSGIKFIQDSGMVDVEFSVNAKFRDAIHEDSSVSVATQGVLGDRYLVVTYGTPGSPLAEPGAELKSDAPRDLKDYLNSADEVLVRVKGSLKSLETILGNFERENRSENTFKNLSTASSNLPNSTQALRSILTKIDGGQGTLGALVNDPSLYEDLKALLGGANRNKVLKYFIRKSVEESREAQKTDKP